MGGAALSSHWPWVLNFSGQVSLSPCKSMGQMTSKHQEHWVKVHVDQGPFPHLESDPGSINLDPRSGVKRTCI